MLTFRTYFSCRYINLETAVFFGAEESKEGQRPRWLARRIRLASRKHGYKLDEYKTPASRPSAYRTSAPVTIILPLLVSTRQQARSAYATQVCPCRRSTKSIEVECENFKYLYCSYFY